LRRHINKVTFLLNHSTTGFTEKQTERFGQSQLPDKNHREKHMKIAKTAYSAAMGGLLAAGLATGAWAGEKTTGEKPAAEKHGCGGKDGCGAKHGCPGKEAKEKAPADSAAEASKEAKPEKSEKHACGGKHGCPGKE